MADVTTFAIRAHHEEKPAGRARSSKVEIRSAVEAEVTPGVPIVGVPIVVIVAIVVPIVGVAIVVMVAVVVIVVIPAVAAIVAVSVVPATAPPGGGRTAGPTYGGETPRREHDSKGLLDHLGRHWCSPW